MNWGEGQALTPYREGGAGQVPPPTATIRGDAWRLLLNVLLLLPLSPVFPMLGGEGTLSPAVTTLLSSWRSRWSFRVMCEGVLTGTRYGKRDFEGTFQVLVERAHRHLQFSALVG